MYQKIRHFVRSASRSRALRAKWEEDRLQLPLTDAHWPLYRSIHKYYDRRLGHFPDLLECSSFNEKIQWLKLFDQNPAMVECVDKVRMRGFIERRLGPGYTPKLYAVFDGFDELRPERLPESFVIKANHDSGSAVIVDDKRDVNWRKLRIKMNRALKRGYGIRGGEWPYQYVDRKILVEERLSWPERRLPADYKFHCIDGKIKYISIIFDRGSKKKEALLEPDGTPTAMFLNPDNIHSMNFPLPTNLSEMSAAVECVAAGFKYVRVDMYSIRQRVIFGELTFYPMGGVYRGLGQKIFGEKLTLDRSTTRPLYQAAISGKR